MRIVRIEKGKSYNGYYLFTQNADYFFITKSKRKNPFMVAMIKKTLNTTQDVKESLQLGTIELKTCSHGDYYSISGDGWGCGDLVKNRQTIIYQYDKVHS
jgi:hypothetical protein